jgi:hypothetical protein
LATQYKKGIIIAKDMITVMLGSLNSSATDRITEFISIPAEEWTEAPESDDDECQLAIALAESDELTAAEACEQRRPKP